MSRQIGDVLKTTMWINDCDGPNVVRLAEGSPVTITHIRPDAHDWDYYVRPETGAVIGVMEDEVCDT